MRARLPSPAVVSRLLLNELIRSGGLCNNGPVYLEYGLGVIVAAFFPFKHHGGY